MNKDKIKHWRKLSKNDKLIYALPKVVEMIDMLEQQQKEINSLKSRFDHRVIDVSSNPCIPDNYDLGA